MHPILSAILTVVGFIVALPIGGYLARRNVVADWDLDKEIEWWFDLVRRGKNAR